MRSCDSHRKFINVIAINAICQGSDPLFRELDISVNNNEQQTARVTVYSPENFASVMHSENKFWDIDVLVCLNVTDETSLNEYRDFSEQRKWYFNSFPEFTGFEKPFELLFKSYREALTRLPGKKITEEKERVIEKALLLMKANKFDKGSFLYCPNIPSDIVFNIAQRMYSPFCLFNLPRKFKVNERQSVMQDEQQKQLVLTLKV